MKNVDPAGNEASIEAARTLRPAARKAGMLMTALMLTTSLCATIAPTLAFAQSPVQQRSFAIRPQRLSSALIEFSNASGINIFFDQNAIGNRSSGGLAGRYTTQAGLAQLLSGTGLTYSFSGANSVTITDRVAAAHGAPVDADGSLVLDTISVTGGGGAFSPDTPYETAGSSNYISRADLERFGTTTTGNMFRGTPGVLNRDNNNSHSLDVNIRGMQGMNRNPIKLDGSMQSLGSYRGYYGVDSRSYIDPAFIGGIDITKGPDGGVNGAGATGGVVNMRTVNADDIIKGDKNWGVKLRGGIFTNTVSPPPIPTQDKRTDIPSIFDINAAQGSAVGAYRTDSFEVVGGFARTSQGNFFTGKHGPTTIRYEHRPGEFIEEPISKVPPGTEILNSQRYTTSALLKARGEFGDGHEVGLTYVYFDSKFGEVMPSEITRTQWDNVRQKIPNEVTAHRVIGQYAWNPAENDLIGVKANVWGTWLDSINRTGTNYGDDWFEDQYRRMPTDTTMYGFDVSNTSRFASAFGDLNVTVGASYSHEDSEPLDKDPQNYVPADGTRSEASAFVQSSLKATDWLRFDAGLRYTTFHTRDRGERNYYGYKQYYGIDYVELDGSGLSPNVSVTVEPLDGLQLFAKYAGGYRGPSLIEATENFNRAPNPYLKAEEAKNWEFGINVLKDSFLMEGDKMRFKAVHFRNRIDNFIGRSQIGLGDGLSLNRSYNMNAAKFEGFEASLDYDAGGWFTNLSGTYYSKVAFCGQYKREYIPGQGNRDIYNDACVERSIPSDYSANAIPPRYSASATLGFRFLEEKLTVGGRLTYVGKRASNGVNADEVSTMPIVRWVPYTLVDAFASYKVNDTVTVDFSAENLTNRYYVDALSLAATPAPGRTFRLNLTAQF